MVLKDLLSSRPLTIPFNTGAEVTATVSAVEPLSRFARHLFYLAPVSPLRLHRRVNVRFAGRETRPLRHIVTVPTNPVF